MATAFNKPMPTIGVDKYTFFKVSKDDSTGLGYEAPVSLLGTVQITPTDAGGSDSFAADNGVYCVEAYTEKMGHDIENADIPAAVEALWRGLDLKNKGMLMTGEAKTVYFGVAWRLTKADGTYRYVKYFKGAYSLGANVGGKTRPAEGASEKQTAKATYTAAKTDYNGGVYYYIDSADVTISASSSSGSNSYKSLAEFETKFFSDMGACLDDSKITTAAA